MAMDSKETRFEGHKVHYWEGGSGFPILMLHGVGPGTSIVGNFGPALEPLTEKFHLFAMDLIGFGGSDRNRNKPFFDVELWVRQAQALLALMPDGPIGVIGHSMGGAIALKLAGREERVAKVMTSCGVGTSYPITDALNAFWSVPQDRDDLSRTMRRMVYSADALTDAMIEDRWKFLAQKGYPEYFAALFAEPRQRFIDAAVLSDAEFRRIKAQIVMLHGRDDQPCPPQLTTEVLARKLPRADIALLGRCGHNLPRERTAAFLQSAFALFADP
jgi:2-hydroxymuconate-semialdehyde hydrolase